MAVNVTIDGKTVEAKEGQTVLDVIREHQLGFIPTLCNSPKLNPIGACSLCVVEIEGMRGLPLACTTKVKDGMKVTAQNERLENIRKTAIDLLLSNHNADCIAPCRLNCPTGVDVQAYLALAKLGEFERGLNLVREKNPFPASVGRVCVRYCELACRRQQVDEPISINMVKRYLADHALETPFPAPPALLDGKGVAIIGGGPGGLSAAHYLRQSGIKSTIFEAHEKLGGMMRYGIPDYRLPQEILDQEINHILNQGGIEVKTGVRLGTDFSLSDLKAQGFEAVFLAMGAQGSRALRLKGEDMQGVMPAIDFLIESKKKGLPKLNGKVVVLGGGNTAIDVCRTAMRAGADSVHVLYRRTEKEMPADAYEIEEAREEGVVFEFLQSPVGLIGENGKLKQIRMQKMELGEPDESGRRRPVPIPGSEFLVDADYCFAAIGQITDIGNAIDDKEVKVPVTGWHTIATMDEYGRTANPWIFAGGDVVLGPAAVIDAIGHGRKAALAMSELIKKRKQINRFNVDQENLFLSTKDSFGGLPEYETAAIPKGKRHWYPAEDPKLRAHDYKLEVQLPPTDEAAKQEATKCLFCGCADFDECELRFMGEAYKLPGPTFKGDSPRRPIEKRNPYFEIDPNKCVLCMRCVRYCDEYMHVDALAFQDRGFDTQVVFPGGDFDESTCTGCGNCTEICPTGAILQKDDFGIITPIKHDTRATVCQLCPASCKVSVHQYTDKMVSVRSRKSLDGDFTDLCGLGRYGNSVVKDGRLTRPMVRKNGELQAVEWDEAINAAAGLIKGQNPVGLLSPWATNQQMVAFSRLIRGAGGMVGSRYELYTGVGPDNLSEKCVLGQGNASYSDIDDSDFILLLNPKAVHQEDVLWHRILRARYDNGANLIIPSGFGDGLARHATTPFVVPKGMISGLLSGALRHISEGTDHPIAKRIDDLEINMEMLELGNELVDILRKAKNPVVVFGADGDDSAYSQDLWLAYMLMNIAQENEPKILIVRQPFNATGLWVTGSTERSEGAETTFEIMRDTKDATFVLFRDNPSADAKDLNVLKRAKHVIVFDTHDSALLNYADVVLPVALPFESKGSIFNGEGKVVKFSPAIRPWVKKDTIELISGLAKRLGVDLGDIDAEIQRRFDLFTRNNLPALPFDIGDKASIPNMLDTFAARAKAHFHARGKAVAKDMVTW